MTSSFGGRTAASYRRFRRDVPQRAVDSLIKSAGWDQRDRIIDLGCGTGQLAVPLARSVGGVIACDIEPDQLVHLRARLHDQAVTNVVPCLIGDSDLGALGPLRATGLVVANALHWIDEPTLIADLPAVLEPGAVIAIVTHGPPLWLGQTGWQRGVRGVLEELLGPVSATCGTDEATLQDRISALRAR